MKSMLLIPVLLGGSLASAQLRTTTTPAADQLRNARKSMEAQTETKVLEKLEQSRMQDERRRLEKFETLNFNMVQDPYAPQSTNSLVGQGGI